MEFTPKHIPVMLREVVEYLDVRPEGVYLDCTAGFGGMTGAIAERLTTGFVIANDRDAESLEWARKNTAAWAEKIRFFQGTFSELGRTVTKAGVEQVDGLIADLGPNLMQLTDPQRGFSFAGEGPLDARMDRSRGVTAEDLVNTLAEKELADVLFLLGEEHRSRQISHAIVRARPIRSARHLAEVVARVSPRSGRLHPATKTFMALRRAVNQEKEELDALLEQAPRLVKPGGRMVVIEFMSLESRAVKLGFRRLVQEGRARLLTKHAVKPGDEEIRANSAARSAKLRAVEMIGE